ncbi:DUF6886 family protein [Actinomarinicola tropica]|uniref:Uncharacterized protein n=1 Tax=Actinomarinicola tropica TaxID=2789776 RepID=A0A5Q2RHQ6_9ACTN|nr:DUF6886 family protein [Actinomarinicola tropica]QGG95323.1 hypothetical protein GH723_09560 [Actinomarinicola tropica]
MTTGRPPAPPYIGEGPHALWHVSEDPTIERFVPHVPASNRDAPPAVWAIDTRHLPTFWFPRDCPRGCIWLSGRESADDRERFFGDTDADRIHVIEQSWLPAVQTTTLHLYRLPESSFARHDVGGYWTSSTAVEPIERLEIDDLVGRHAGAGIELRITPSIWPWWRQVAASTLDFSGSRLRNAAPHPLAVS